jgi:23S rRNA-/tRNA-specific pseudouridylate synthase
MKKCLFLDFVERNINPEAIIHNDEDFYIFISDDDRIFGQVTSCERQKCILCSKIDPEISGCIMVPKGDKAIKKILQLSSLGRIRRSYYAIVTGVPELEGGSIAVRLKRSADPRIWKLVKAEDGVPTISTYKVLAVSKKYSLIKVNTAKEIKHQVRAHCAFSGWPVKNDPIYGVKNAERIRLTIGEIEILGPSGERVFVSGPRYEEWVSTLLEDLF